MIRRLVFFLALVALLPACDGHLGRPDCGAVPDPIRRPDSAYASGAYALAFACHMTWNF